MDHHRWIKSWKWLGLTPSAEMADCVEQAYGESHRAYHTLEHISECFAQFDCAAHLLQAPGEVAMAIWFHDIIYNPRASDNEAASASYATEHLMDCGASKPLCMRIADLIMATTHTTTPSSVDEAILMDIDLTILGTEPIRFNQYEKQIRHEYDWVPVPVYCARRAEILQAFLDRPAIYYSPYFHNYEQQALANLKRAIKHLASENMPPLANG